MRARAGRRRVGWAAGGAVVAIGLFWLVSAPATSGALPYDPSSVAPDGAKALAILLERLGARVGTSGALPATGRGVALVLDDQLDDQARAQVTDWVRRGGALVVADPSSPLEGAAPAQGLPDQAQRAPGVMAPGCQAPWAGGVQHVATAGDDLLEVPAGAYACFPQGGDAFAIARDEGAGVVVSLGGADLWSNAYLGDDDNALLAANLLVPGRGYAVSWLLSPRVGGGTATLWSLVPGRGKWCLAGLVAALLVACLWQARRLGRPVLEDPLVPVPGSELVVATGRLLARNRSRGESAKVLREDLCSQLRPRFGQAPGTEPATVAQVAAMHVQLPPQEVSDALCGPPPAGEEQLLALARTLQHIREEVLSGRTTTG
ncbi:MAG: DUF4350 domain-containing protein [Acidimicrobiales bacterium]